MIKSKILALLTYIGAGSNDFVRFADLLHLSQDDCADPEHVATREAAFALLVEQRKADEITQRTGNIPFSAASMLSNAPIDYAQLVAEMKKQGLVFFAPPAGPTAPVADVPAAAAPFGVSSVTPPVAP